MVYVLSSKIDLFKSLTHHKRKKTINLLTNQELVTLLNHFTPTILSF